MFFSIPRNLLFKSKESRLTELMLSFSLNSHFQLEKTLKHLSSKESFLATTSVQKKWLHQSYSLVFFHKAQFISHVHVSFKGLVYDTIYTQYATCVFIIYQNFH